MLLNQINLNHLHVFAEVYKTKSMTIAAEKLHLTQSGVSQHIKALEDSLKITLFDRINQRIIPTAAAADLYEQCNLGLDTIEKALWKIRGDSTELGGIINIGMPIEFGNSLIIPLLSKFGKAHKNIKYQIYLDFANKLNEMLLDGEIDFAFVDDYKMDKRIQTEIIYTERLALCTHADNVQMDTTTDRKYFENLSYVDYQKDAPILNMWFEHHLGSKLNVNVRAYVMDVQGIARFITNGFAAGILPMHVIRKLETEGHKVHIFKVKDKELEKHVSVAFINNKTQSRSAAQCLKFLQDSLRQH
ncbi:MAG: LysR family transcriptional regulator [Bdellovibrionales bacterium]|nr:LysR family transcriptional regulator [Bdellovibrionales bacterium]